MIILDYLPLAIYYLLYIMYLILFARVILSWFRLPLDHPIEKILFTLTEPILAPLRFLVSKSIFGGRKGGMIIDISPLIAFIFIRLLQEYVAMFINWR